MVLTTIIAFVFVLGVVVLVHELGHFLVAKMNGIYVMTFSFGLGPKLFKRRFGETEYAICAIPFGGYVKFAGESFEDEGTASEEQESEFDVPEDQFYRNKKPPQKMAVVIAGPLMNAILAVVLFILLAWFQGLYVNPSTVIGEVKDGTPAATAGFLPGDRILAINGEPFRYWNDIQSLVTFDEGVSSSFTVERGADTLIIDVAPGFDAETNLWLIGIGSPLPARVGNIKRDSPADKAGVKPGSVILSINDSTVTYWRELEEKIHAQIGIEMKFTWEHDGERYTAMITPEGVDAPAEGERLDVIKVGSIGIGAPYERVNISLRDAVNHGLRSCSDLLVLILDFLGKLVTGKATVRAVGGPIKVSIMAGDMLRWGFDYLIYFLAFLSLNLTIFNLLPILPFDGGHFVIHFYEFVSRRRLNQRIHTIMVQIGYVILIVLMASIFFIDVLNIFR